MSASLPAGARTLQRIDDALAASAAPDERARLLALRVQTLARMRRQDEAQAALRGLQRLVGAQPSAMAHAWMLFAQACQQYFAGQLREALATFDDCARLASNLGLVPLAAQARGAQVFAHLQIDDLGAAIRACMTVRALGAGAGPAALYQLHLALGSIRQAGGDLAGALGHFERALAYAQEAGDLLAVGAINTRAAGLHAWRTRKAVAQGATDGPERAASALKVLDEAIAAAVADQTHAVLPELEMLRAGMLRLLGRCDEALAAFECFIPIALEHGLRNDALLASADRALCLLSVGRSDEALAVARAAADERADAHEHEVRAIALENLATVLQARAAGGDEPARLRAEATAQWEAAQRKQVSALAAALDEMGEN
jgi:tetratricopeptide (TPR) repeat protein